LRLTHFCGAPKHGGFALFWGGRALSLLGSAITSVALPILVYRLTASALLTSLLATLEVLPYLLFGLFAGEIADHVNRRWLMVGSDVFNALLFGSIPLAGWLQILTIPQIFAVAFLSASAFVWFDAAYSAMTSMSTMVGIVGPAIGGGLAATIGPASAISFDAVSSLFSGLSLLLIPRALSNLQRREQGAQAPIPRMLTGIGEGMRFIWHHGLVRVLTLVSFGLSFTSGAVNGLLVVYAVQALHLASTDARIGLLFTVGSGGSFVASVLLTPLSKRVPIGWITEALMSLNLLLLLFFARLSELSLALVVYACWGLSYTLTTTNGMALRQLVTLRLTFRAGSMPMPLWSPGEELPLALP
jgi:MFS family permease